MTSLGAGSDKGETEARLPLRLFFGFVKFCFGCLVDFLSPFLCHLCIVFVWPSLCCIFVCLCLGFVAVLVLVFVFSSLVLSCFALPCLVLSCLCLFLFWLCLCPCLCPCLCLVFSSLLLSRPYLVLSCLLFVSSWGSCGVIFGRLGGRLGSFLVVLGVVLGILGALGASFWGSWAVFGRLESVLKAVDGIRSAQDQQSGNRARPSVGFELQLGPPKGTQNDRKTNKNR